MTLPPLDTRTGSASPLSGAVWARFVLALLVILLMLAGATICNTPAETLSARPAPDKVLTQGHKEL